MLTVPWFVVKTVHDLFRLKPTPFEPQQYQPLQQQQHQPLQQQQHQPLQQQQHQPLQQQQVSQPQNKQPQLQQRQRQQQQIPTLQQKQSPQKQNEAPKLAVTRAENTAQSVTRAENTAQSVTRAENTAQSVTRAENTAQSVTRAENTAQSVTRAENTAQSVTRAENTAQSVTRAENTAQSVTRAENTAQSVTRAENTAQSVTRAENTAQAVTRAENTAQPVTRAENTAQPVTRAETTAQAVIRAENTAQAVIVPPAVNAELVQTQTAAPLQQSTSATQQRVEKTASPRLAEAPSIASPTPVVETSLKTSSRTLVLAPSVSVGRMSVEWAQQQVEKFKFDFDKADKDKSGTLSFNEVYNVLHQVGFKGTNEEAKAIFSQLDRDRDQKVTREEFAAALKKLPRLSIQEFVLRKTFLKLDKDGSGYLSRSEIQDATKSEGGLDISANKIADLLIFLVKDEADKKVSYEEFLHVFGVESAATVMRQVFAKIDADGSGYLTKEEILDAVKAESELKLKAEKISDLLIYWCRDKDKKISYQEFVDVWLKQKEEKPAK